MLSSCQFDPFVQFDPHGESELQLTMTIGMSKNPEESKQESLH